MCIECKFQINFEEAIVFKSQKQIDLKYLRTDLC